MFMYDYDSNSILAEPIKNRRASTIRDAFLNIHKVLKARGSKPKVYIITFNIKRKGFSDLTSVFLHKSSRGNLYAMVMYDYDSNSILAEPIKNRQAETIRDLLLKIHKVLKAKLE